MRLPALLLSLVSTILLYGCIKEYSYEGGMKHPVDTGTVEIKREWRFTAEVSKYNGPVDTAYLMEEGVATTLTITGATAARDQFLSIKLKSVNSTIKAGQTYKTTAGSSSFSYSNQVDVLYESVPVRPSGELYVTITEIDSTKVTGTFEGLVLDGNQKSVRITAGYFSSPLKKASAATTGSLMLWARAACAGAINVKVNGQGNLIQKFYYSPDCGEEGTATYSLPPGRYNWAAYCGTDSLTGTAEVQAGTCTKIFIHFPFEPAPETNTNPILTCKLTWVYFSSTLEKTPHYQGNDVKTVYAGNTPDYLEYYVSPAPVALPHPISYSGDTIVIDDKSDYKKYFVKDSRGRIKKYHGFNNPVTFLKLEPIVVEYEYDNEDQLVKRVERDGRYLYATTEMRLTWRDGNIQSISQTFPLSGFSRELVYTYYDKEVTSMPFTEFDAFELVLFQSILNFGKSVKHAPKAVIITTLGKSTTYDYNNYVIDANRYVLSCQRSYKGDLKTTFLFNYTCF